MRQDDLDRILSEKQEIVPSAGFLDGVMAAVEREACAPPPIPFPWKRAIPGIAAAVTALAMLAISARAAFARGAANAPSSDALTSAVASFVYLAQSMHAGWLVLALVLSLVSVKLAGGFSVSRT